MSSGLQEETSGFQSSCRSKRPTDCTAVPSVQVLLCNAQLAVITIQNNFYFYLGNRESFSFRLFCKRKTIKFLNKRFKNRNFEFLSEIRVYCLLSWEGHIDCYLHPRTRSPWVPVTRILFDKLRKKGAKYFKDDKFLPESLRRTVKVNVLKSFKGKWPECLQSTSFL